MIFSIISCKSNNDDKKIEELDERIALIDENKVLDNENNINECLNIYYSLTVDEQSKLTNKEKLLRLEVSLKEELSIKKVIELIDLIPDNVTLNDNQIVSQAREVYNSLDAGLQNRINNLSKLDNAEKRLFLLNKVQAVIDKINNIPSPITLDDEEYINSCVASYAELSADEQALVNNYNKVEEALDEIERLKGIETLKQKAQVIIDLIDKLPSVDDLTINDRKTLGQVRTRYNSLAATARPYVTNLNKLQALEARMEELVHIEELKKEAKAIDDLILALPSVDELKYEDREQVTLVRSLYNSLSDDVKPYVEELPLLISIEAKMRELIENREYSVKFYLYGGVLEGSSDVIGEDIAKLKVNYYSTGFFSVYASEVCLYKTSLISDDSFTYAYKIGFSLTDGSYVVKQIIGNGVALNDTNKTSDYYLIVHSDNSLYETLGHIEVGDYLIIDKELPNTSTSSLNAGIVISRKSSTGGEYVIINYKGINTLPTPIKNGYTFKGWYESSSFVGSPITESTGELTVYARWFVSKEDVTVDNILDLIPDVLTSNTEIELLTQNDEGTFTWSTDNPNLLTIKNGMAYVNKCGQTHKKQTINVSVVINRNGTKETKSKTVTVNPILFTPMPDTPVSTYFYTGALTNYQRYSERYQREKTIFSESSKEVLNIVNYSFAVPESSGSVTISNTTYIPDVNALRVYDVRNILVINGVGSDTSKNFYNLTKTDATIKVFVNNIMNKVEEYNFDGVDIDWEYVSSSYPIVASQVNALMKALREEMTKRQDEGGSPYLLTAAIPASSWGTETNRWDFPTLNIYLDYINIMSYDLNNSSKATHLSPLYSSTSDGGYGFGAQWGVERMASLGFSRSKLIIGAAGYGKAYKVTGTPNNSNYPGLGAAATLTQVSGISGSFASGTVYGNAIEEIISQGNFKEYNEYNSSGKLVGSYLYNSTSKIFITFDSSFVIKEKYNYARATKGMGIMFWAYTEDTSDHILNAIYEVYKK